MNMNWKIIAFALGIILLSTGFALSLWMITYEQLPPEPEGASWLPDEGAGPSFFSRGSNPVLRQGGVRRLIG